jgi:hypothetical protein
MEMGSGVKRTTGTGTGIFSINIQTYPNTSKLYLDTIWLFNIAMERSTHF